jgi:hypothetical protein
MAELGRPGANQASCAAHGRDSRERVECAASTLGAGRRFGVAGHGRCLGKLRAAGALGACPALRTDPAVRARKGGRGHGPGGRGRAAAESGDERLNLTSQKRESLF